MLWMASMGNIFFTWLAPKSGAGDPKVSLQRKQPVSSFSHFWLTFPCLPFFLNPKPLNLRFFVLQAPQLTAQTTIRPPPTAPAMAKPPGPSKPSRRGQWHRWIPCSPRGSGGSGGRFSTPGGSGKGKSG